MARTLTVAAETLARARREFGRFYRESPPEAPPRLARRELAAFPFAAETMMRRHAAVRTVEELWSFLQREVPRHVYYSSAYYRKPAEPTMLAKQWLGADLIFDLDADHLRGAEALSYAEQLRRVKERLRDLYDDFLLRDFGVDPDSTQIVFSGGRGYHVHVRGDRFLGLTSPERRELVDYLTGAGFDPGSVVEPRRDDAREDWMAEDPSTSGGTGRSRAARVRRLADPQAPGWKGRTTRALYATLLRWEEEGAEAAGREIAALGVTTATAKRWARLLVEQGGGRRIRESGHLDVFPKEFPAELFEAVLTQAKIVVQGETDAPVTTDVHRLIRLPGSLHGGTGLRVVPLAREELDPFDPFRDARLPAAEEPVRVRYTARVDYPFPDGGLRGSPGATDELPTAQGLFLLLRGEAELRPSPG